MKCTVCKVVFDESENSEMSGRDTIDIWCPNCQAHFRAYPDTQVVRVLSPNRTEME
jgi:rubredoxin